MRYHVTVSGITHEVEVEDGRAISLDGRPVDATLEPIDGTPVSTLRLGRVVLPIVAELRQPGQWTVRLRSGPVIVDAVDDRTKTIRDMAGPAAGMQREAHVRAPMPGLVIKVAVSEGDTVRPGQAIAIVEAMKMENELTSEVEGQVASVLVVAGQTVEKNQILVELTTEPAGDTDGA